MRSYSFIERLFNSAFKSLLNAIINLGIPLLIVIGIVAIIFLGMKIKYGDKFKQQINREFLIKLAKYSTFMLYIFFILNITLLCRIGKPQSEPLSGVWLGWNPLQTENRMYIDSQPILNVIMFIPMAFELRFLLNKKKNLALLSTISAMTISIIIEASQLIFRLGTVQVSDLVYNTLGGAIGYLIYRIIKKHINKKAL